MFGVILAAGWLLLDVETDSIMEALWFFVLGTGLSFVVDLLGPFIQKLLKKQISWGARMRVRCECT